MWKLISVMDLERQFKEQEPMILLDIRTFEDYAGCHIPGAVCVPEERLSEYLLNVPKNYPAVLICYRGPRSIRAARRLSAEGYHVSAVCGGMEAWKRMKGMEP